MSYNTIYNAGQRGWWTFSKIFRKLAWQVSGNPVENDSHIWNVRDEGLRIWNRFTWFPQQARNCWFTTSLLKFMAIFFLNIRSWKIQLFYVEELSNQLNRYLYVNQTNQIPSFGVCRTCSATTLQYMLTACLVVAESHYMHF